MNMLVIDVIKRNGRRPNETYDTDKLQRSIRAACLSVRSPEGEAETISKKVAAAVTTWCEKKATVTSQDIRRITSKQLERYHPEAAYIYQHHRTII